MQISIVGTGYVGLVTGVCFAEMGNDVICADIDPRKIEVLNSGKCPIYEPGLPELISSNVRANRLQFTTNVPELMKNSKLVFIAVGTPSDVDGRADLSFVLDVAKTIAENMTDYCAIVTKSTVPVGTAAKVKAVIKKVLDSRGLATEFDVISNPEFLKEGSAVEDCLKPSRIVVGCESERASDLMRRLFEPFVKNGNPFCEMDLISAELTKYAANAMLATKISFINEISRICERVGADVELVRKGIGADPRIGPHFIYPGLGYGGSCFPKDVRALIKTAEGVDEDAKLLRAVVETNDLQKNRFFNRIFKHFSGNLKGKKIAIWGLAFKPGTDDVREAPALSLIKYLIGEGASVSAFDPVAITATKQVLGDVGNLTFSESLYDVVSDADALCIVTEWKPFREPNFSRLKKLMKQAVIFDGRNLYAPSSMRDERFTYYSIGRAVVSDAV